MSFKKAQGGVGGREGGAGRFYFQMQANFLQVTVHFDTFSDLANSSGP